MKKAKEVAGRKCPICGKTENQLNAGKNRSGTQRCFCKDCKKYYTLEPKIRENTYIMTMVSRLPRQIVGFDVAFDKSSERIQRIVDNGSEADYYCTDGYLGYVDIVYPCKHIRNVHNKSNTFTA